METMMQELKEGNKAPDFSLKDTNGKTVKLSDYKGRDVVLYFYPKDDTPGCSVEACGFRDSIDKLKNKGAVVLGVSLDDQQSHIKFTEKYKLNFPLLCDTDAKVSKIYGAYVRKNMYGNESWGVARTTFIIGKDGKIRKIFHKVQPEGHSKEVIAVL